MLKLIVVTALKKFYILVLFPQIACSFSTEYKLMTWQVLKIYLFINILLTRIKLLKYYSSFSRMSLGWKADIFFVTLHFQTMQVTVIKQSPEKLNETVLCNRFFPYFKYIYIYIILKLNFDGGDKDCVERLLTS